MNSPRQQPLKITVTIICALLLPSIVFAQWSGPVNISPNAISAGLNESMGSCIGVSGDTVHVVWGKPFQCNAWCNLLYAFAGCRLNLEYSRCYNRHPTPIHGMLQ